MPDRPKVGGHLELVSAAGPGGHNVVHNRATGKYLRMRLREFEFLRALDGERPLAEVRNAHPDRLPPEWVDALMARFVELQLLEGTTVPDAGDANRRFRLGDGTAIQFALLDPDRTLDRCLPLIRVALGPVGMLFGFLLVLVGVSAFVTDLGGFLSALGRPVDLAVLLTAFGAAVITTMLHEFAHAATVKYYGGSVTRIGVMLFYFFPALFCDTSDAWRFQSRWQRVAVSAAGIWFELVLSAMAAIAFRVVDGDGALDSWLALFAAGNVLACLYNLVPFVKLDGYWMLSNAIDVPNFRSKSITYLASWARWVVTGTGRPARHPRHPVLWALFALASTVFAPLLISTALLTYQQVLLQFGATGAILWLGLAASALLLPLAKLPRLLGWLVSERKAVLVRSFVCLTAIGVLMLAGAQKLTLPVLVSGSYEISEQETPRGPAVARIYLEPSHASPVDAGDTVELYGRSFVVPSVVARTSVTEVRDGTRWVSPVPTVPIKNAARLPKREQRVLLAAAGGADRTTRIPRSGPAKVLAAPEPLPGWLYLSFWRPVSQQLLPNDERSAQDAIRAR